MNNIGHHPGTFLLKHSTHRLAFDFSLGTFCLANICIQYKVELGNFTAHGSCEHSLAVAVMLVSLAVNIQPMCVLGFNNISHYRKMSDITVMISFWVAKRTALTSLKCLKILC